MHTPLRKFLPLFLIATFSASVAPSVAPGAATKTPSVEVYSKDSAFAPPTIESARAAIGTLNDMPPRVRALLEPDDGDFALMGVPAPGDWLAEHAEYGQTFDDFVAKRASTFLPQRRIIYLQPIGKFDSEFAPSLEALEEYATAFFQIDACLLPPIEIDERAMRVRLNPGTGKPQLLTTAVLASLRDFVPPDAHCVIAITMSDLYPKGDWNFVFGQASPRERTAVFSFARHDPAFFDEPRPDDAREMILQRSAKTLVHEIAHTFGLQHCVFFHCLENGSNSQRESDAAPQHLCPVCLHKLQRAVGIDLVKRYRDLKFFYDEHGWADESAWVARQIEKTMPPPVPAIVPRGLPTTTAELPPGVLKVPLPPLVTPEIPKQEPQK